MSKEISLPRESDTEADPENKDARLGAAGGRTGKPNAPEQNIVKKAKIHSGVEVGGMPNTALAKEAREACSCYIMKVSC